MGSGTFNIVGSNEADAGTEDLGLLHPRLQASEFHRSHAVLKRAVGHPLVEVSGDDAGLVLRHAHEKFLAIAVANSGVRQHDDAGLGSISARLPAALGAHHLTVLILLGVLPQVPDVSLLVLGVPIEGLLLQLSVHEDAVQNHDGADPQNALPVVSHDGHVDLGLTILHALEHEAGARPERKERVIHRSYEVVGIKTGRDVRLFGQRGAGEGSRLAGVPAQPRKAGWAGCRSSRARESSARERKQGAS